MDGEVLRLWEVRVGAEFGGFWVVRAKRILPVFQFVRKANFKVSFEGIKCLGITFEGC